MSADPEDELHDAATPAEQALTCLLRAQGVGEAEAAVVRGARECLGARWAACFRPVGEAWGCSAVDGDGPQVGSVLRRAPGDPAAVEPDAEVVMPLDAGESGEVLLVLGPGPGEGYPPEALRLLERMAGCWATALGNAATLDQLRSQVLVDFISGCYNRRGFEEHLTVEMVRSRRYRRPLSLLIVDLDQFKQTNDEMGHQVGDHALRRIGALLRGAFRTTDVVCRYGGDEFAVVFPETPKADVARLAERVRKQIGALFPDGVVTGAITASCGVASYPDDADDADALVRVADKALYRAKAAGRNRVELA